MGFAVIDQHEVVMALIPDTSYTVVKTGFRTAFHYAPVRAIIKQAIDFATPLRIQGQLLATFHVIRLVENSIPIPRLKATFWKQCYAAVSHSTGVQAEQFDPATNPLLAASLIAYNQHLPVGHQLPERPTLIKDVSSTYSSFASGTCTPCDLASQMISIIQYCDCHILNRVAFNLSSPNCYAHMHCDTSHTMISARTMQLFEIVHDMK